MVSVIHDPRVARYVPAMIRREAGSCPLRWQTFCHVERDSVVGFPFPWVAMRWFLTSVVVASLAACAPSRAADPALRPVHETSYRLGEVQRATVGDPIVEVRAAKRVPTYLVVSDFTPPTTPLMGIPEQLTRGMVFRAFRSAGDGDLILMSEEFSTVVGIRIDTRGVVTGGFVDQTGRTVLRGSWPDEPLFEVSRDPSIQVGAFRAHIVYSGVEGGVLRGFYREYLNGIAEPSFAEELLFDLNGTRVIVFRSLRIEVLHAGPDEVVFRVREDGGLPWLPGT
jgi:hypothetical protein